MERCDTNPFDAQQDLEELGVLDKVCVIASSCVYSCRVYAHFSILVGPYAKSDAVWEFGCHWKRVSKSSVVGDL